MRKNNLAKTAFNIYKNKNSILALIRIPQGKLLSQTMSSFLLKLSSLQRVHLYSFYSIQDQKVLLFKDKHMFFCFLVLNYDYVIVTKKKFSKAKETKKRNKWVRKALMLIYKIIRIKKVLYSIKFFCFHTQKHSI